MSVSCRLQHIACCASGDIDVMAALKTSDGGAGGGVDRPARYAVIIAQTLQDTLQFAHPGAAERMRARIGGLLRFDCDAGLAADFIEQGERRKTVGSFIVQTLVLAHGPAGARTEE